VQSKRIEGNLAFVKEECLYEMYEGRSKIEEYESVFNIGLIKESGKWKVNDFE